MTALRKCIRRGSLLLLLLIVILSALWGIAPILYAQAPFEIGYGETKNGEVGNQLGDLWVFSGCLQDVVTITMVSPRYGSTLELYGPIGREPLRAQSSNGAGQPAAIASYTLPASGKYAIIATGATVLSRGAYTLTLQSQSNAGNEHGQVEGFLNEGNRVTGTVEARMSDEWLFQGCINDSIGVSVESDDFVPYVGIFGAAGNEKLAESYGSGHTASLNPYVLGRSGAFVVRVSGAGILNHGDYTLSFDVVARPENGPVGNDPGGSGAAGCGSAAFDNCGGATGGTGTWTDNNGSPGWNPGGNPNANTNPVLVNTENLSAQPIVCNNFNGEAGWKHTHNQQGYSKDWYEGWGFSALEGEAYNGTIVTSTNDETAGLSNNNSIAGSRDKQKEYAAKIASTQPHAGYYTSPIIPVPPGFEGGEVEVKLRYYIWDDNRGVRKDGNELVDLIVKPNAFGPPENGQHFQGLTRGSWTDANRKAELGNAKDLLVIVQAWSTVALDSNIYLDDIVISFTKGATTRWITDCKTDAALEKLKGQVATNQ